MNISRSGYYKWLKTRDILNRHEINRKDLEPLIRDIHKRKPVMGIIESMLSFEEKPAGMYQII